jgi:hypothetical protein
VRVRHEVAEARLEERRHVLHGDAAPGEDAREHVGKAVRLRDRKRDPSAAIVAAVEPRPA